jgi:nitroimidazol reductase NimA-like FMN-containing flavoprotein (pyridoxamine 5'-phosphate oxidase superfamily)
MLIYELDRQASLNLLSRLRFGRLACASDNQPYVIPIHYAYEDGLIYCLSTVGKKLRWMRRNPRVCLQIDEIHSPQKWMSVIVDGTFEELPHAPQFQSARARAHHLLEERRVWWEPGFAKVMVSGEPLPLEPLYFFIRVGEISGRQGIPERELADRGRT